MKFLLTSSGITNESIARALAELVGKPLSESSIIHIPTAATLFDDDKSWLIDNLVNLQKQKFKCVDILDITAVPPGIWKARLQAADIISFGGGDEQYLAKVFRELGMKEFLLSILDTKVYVGASAGSMVAGQFLPQELITLIYPEEDFGDLESPMGLYDFTFIPHLNSDFFAHVRKDNLEKLKEKLEHSAYATDDETAVKVADGEITIVGAGDYWIFKKS